MPLENDNQMIRFEERGKIDVTSVWLVWQLSAINRKAAHSNSGSGGHVEKEQQAALTLSSLGDFCL